MRNDKLILYGLGVLGLATFVWVVVSFVSSRNESVPLQPGEAAAFASEQADPCQTPPGYTDAEWQEHMSHHPDRYQKCLTQ